MRQGYAEPAGSQPVSEIMELYANNQTSWIDDYIPVHEKMVRNGYPNGLHPTPENTGIVCPLPTGNEYVFCYLNSPGVGQVFMIGSRYTATTQQWQWSASNSQLMNVATGLHLALNGQTLWELEMTSTSDWIIKAAVFEKAIDVGRGSLSMDHVNRNSPWQVFYPINIAA